MKNTRQQLHNFWKRGLSFLLSLLLLTQCILLPAVPRATAADASQSSGSIPLGDTNIQSTETLVDNGDGTYTLKLTYSTKADRTDINEDYQSSRNHYFVAPVTGQYMVELWGGKGGDGQSTKTSILGYQYGSDGGKGGAAGHVYGLVTLNAGDILYYTLGGNGTQTIASTEGGGVNGDGGHHGDTGSAYVGGGGGYSALFHFTRDQFAKYLNADGSMKTNSITDADRTSKYIMIAAGGGGGGAGDGLTFSDAIQTADGGAGGSVGGVSGRITGTVNGTFYAGSNGKSSGTDDSYVGHGGTNEPGTIKQTYISLFQGKQPNNWAGTANDNYMGGAGGSGNLRGGGGGGGYCGGSGGIMTSLVVANNVGGGGGGSSFVADSVNVAGATPSATNDSETGGAVSIRYVSSGENETGLEEVTVSGALSPYFELVSVNSTPAADKKNFQVKASLLPNEEDMVVELQLKCIDGFAGGNNVPLLAALDGSTGGEQVLVQSTKSQLATKVADTCAYVNVPLQFNVGAQNYGPVEPGTEVALTNLYTDYYTDVRNNLESDPRYAFIQRIDNHYVDGVDTATVQPSETTSYPICLPVAVKDTGVAAVGQPVESTTFTVKAAVLVFSSTDGINAPNLTHSYIKNLTYADGKYILSLGVSGSATQTYTPTAAPEKIQVTPGSTPAGVTANTDGTYTYTVPESGYYLLQAWGGNGGKGGGGKPWWGLGGSPVDGGAGGTGGYVSGYVYLEKNDTLTFNLAANGTPGADYAISSGIFDFYKNGTGGTGGGYTYIQKTGAANDGYLLIAGGGGGGEPGKDGAAGRDGNSVTETTANATQPSGDLSSTYSGKTASDEAGGAAGKNYKNTGKMDVDVTDNALLDDNKKLGASTDYPNTSGGAVYISCLQMDTTGAEAAALAALKALPTDYALSANISSYFTVESVTATGGATTVTGTSENNTVSISGIQPALQIADPQTNTDGTVTLTGTFTFQVDIVLQPNILGGNDVPVLVTGEGSTGMRLSRGTNTMAIANQDATDFANVAIGDIGALETYDYTYVLGTTWDHDLYDWLNPPTLDPAFLVASESCTPGTPPTESTLYTATATVSPVNNPSQKAVVVPSVESKSITKTAQVQVINQVNYDNVSHLRTNDTQETVSGHTIYPLELDQEYQAILSPVSGYVLPDPSQVQVKVDDPVHGLVAIDAFTYHADSGELIIPASSIKNRPVYIYAEASPKTFSVRFVDSSGSIRKTFSGLAAGADMQEVKDWAQANAASDRTGYTFRWMWETENGEAPDQMPANDIWVIGDYLPKPYNVEIICFYVEDGEEITLTTETAGPFLYDTQFLVEAPQISNYAAKTPVIQGTMAHETDAPITEGTADTLGKKTVRVEYIPLEGKLIIDYLKADGTQAAESQELTVNAGATYEVVSPTLTGYLADKPVVRGTMPADGLHVVVTYTPNRYQLQFIDPLVTDGSRVLDTWTVQYDDLYGYRYDADGNRIWSSFPQPATIPIGKTFEGWYLDEDGDGNVTAADRNIKPNTTVALLGNANLVALWKDQEYYITTEYRYIDDTLIASEKLPDPFTYQQTYSITPNAALVPDQFSTEHPVYTGKMGNQDMTLVIYCTGTFNLVIHYVYYDDPDGSGSLKAGDKVAEDYILPVAYTKSYDVPSPAPTVEDVDFTYTERIFGTMDETGKEFTVYYYTAPPVISVTVAWGNLTFAAQDIRWEPESHTYTVSDFKPQGNNTITVTSNAETNVSVYTGFTYTPRALYPDILASFTDSGNQTITGYREVKRQQSFTAYLNLYGSGKLGRLLDFSCGNCSVTITNIPPS